MNNEIKLYPLTIGDLKKIIKKAAGVVGDSTPVFFDGDMQEHMKYRRRVCVTRTRERTKFQDISHVGYCIVSDDELQEGWFDISKAMFFGPKDNE